LSARHFHIVRCRCGHTAGSFDAQPKKCPRCHRPMKRTSHRIPDFVQPGARVNYSPIIGEPPEVLDCIITSEVFVMGQTPCCMIDKRRGAVAADALSEVR
jgi:hypothetical protein